MNIDLINKISDNSETLLLPLYARVLEAKSKNPILNDPQAIEITERLNEIFKDSGKRIHRKLRRGKLPSKLAVSLSLRAAKFDQYTRNFLDRYPDALIVSMGCGLDTRHARLDMGNAVWIDIDLPEVIEIRKALIDESDHHRFMGASVTSVEWLDSMMEYQDRPALFIAEGLFMYLKEDEVKSILLRIHNQFKKAELVCEITGEWIVKMLERPLFRKRFQRKNYLSKDAIFTYGVHDSHDFEAWHPDFKLVEEWTYLDDRHPKLGWMNWFGYFELFRKVQWMVYYCLSG